MVLHVSFTKSFMPSLQRLSLFVYIYYLNQCCYNFVGAEVFITHPHANQKTGLEVKLAIKFCFPIGSDDLINQLYEVGQLGVFKECSDDSCLKGDLHSVADSPLQTGSWNIYHAWKQRIQQNEAKEYDTVNSSEESCFFAYYYYIELKVKKPGKVTIVVVVYNNSNTQHTQSNMQVEELLTSTKLTFYTELPVPNVSLNSNLFRTKYFEQIWNSCRWSQFGNSVGHDGVKSCSGWSTPKLTNLTRNVLLEVLLNPQYNIHAFLDAPCGDMQYMSYFMDEIEVLLRGGESSSSSSESSGNRSLVHYGADIVTKLIYEHANKYSEKAWSGSFKVVDFANENGTFVGDLSQMWGHELPPIDLIYSRQMMQHLSENDTCAVLRNFNRTGARFLLASTFLTSANEKKRKTSAESIVYETLSEADAGNYMKQNLFLPPFNLPIPLYIARDDPKSEYIYLALWNLPLPSYVCGGT